MNVISIQSDVENGELEKDKLNHLLRRVKDFEGKRVSVVLKEYEKTRSLNQNDFLHGVFFLAMMNMLKEAGDDDITPEKVKELFKNKFGIKWPVYEPDGTVSIVNKPTRRYTTKECESTMQDARAHYATWYQLPFPNEGDL